MPGPLRTLTYSVVSAAVDSVEGADSDSEDEELLPLIFMYSENM